MIELNKPYLYKNKTVYPAVVEGSSIICFDSKGKTVFVKKEADLTRIEEKSKIVEPTYIKKEEVVKAPEVVKPVPTPVQPVETVKPIPIPAQPVVPAKPVPIQKPVEQPTQEVYDDFYDVKVTQPTKKKRVNVTEKNDYI